MTGIGIRLSSGSRRGEADIPAPPAVDVCPVQRLTVWQRLAAAHLVFEKYGGVGVQIIFGAEVNDLQVKAAAQCRCNCSVDEIVYEEGCGDGLLA